MQTNITPGLSKKKLSLFDLRNKKFLIVFIALVVIAGLYIIYRSFAGTGVVMTGAEGEFTPVSPTRILDTRNGVGGVNKALSTNAPVSIKTVGYLGSSSLGDKQLEGRTLPASEGGVAEEDPINENGVLVNSTKGEAVTFPKFAALGQEYRDYYITMRWPYTNWAWDGTDTGKNQAEFDWYGSPSEPRKVLVTNPANGKSIIADILESGPAPWTGTTPDGGNSSVNQQQKQLWGGPRATDPAGYTGRVGGLPPKAMQALGAENWINNGPDNGGSGSKLQFSWAPDQSAKPGPVDSTTLNAGSVGKVSSAVINLTIAKAPADGYVTVWPSDEPRPTSSSINFKAGQTIANQITTKVGKDGKVNVYTSANGTNVVMDLFGYYSSKEGNRGSRFTFQPMRVVDTRNQTGIYSIGGRLGSGNTGWGDSKITKMAVNGSNINAATYTLTAVDPLCDGYLTIWPTGTPRPVISSLNYKKGETISNQVTVPLGQDKAVSLYSSCSGGAYVIMDLVGYYAPPASGQDQQGRYYPITPARTYDTRGVNNLPLLGGQNREVKLKETARPNYISGVNTNSVIINPTATGYYTGWKIGTDRPGTASINFIKGQTVAGASTIAVPAESTSVRFNTFINTGSAHFAVDTSGYFAADPPKVGSIGTPTSSDVSNNPTGLSKVSTIAAGNGSTCAIVEGDSINLPKVKCWGENRYGQLGDGTTNRSLSPVISSNYNSYEVMQPSGLSLGRLGTVCLSSGRGVGYCWGNNTNNLIDSSSTKAVTIPTLGGNVRSLDKYSVGSQAVCGTSGLGYITGVVSSYCWGSGFNTASAQQVVMSVDVQTMDNSACSLQFQGKAVYCWGSNDKGQLGDGTNTNSATPKKLDIGGVRQLSAKGNTACALMGDNTVYCWGYNYYGQAGAGQGINYVNKPTKIANLENVSSISVGANHACAVMSDGTAKCWGRNSDGTTAYGGQLGDGSTTTRYAPVTVQGLSGLTKITAGENHTCALAKKLVNNVLADGYAYCWGANGSGQLGDGTTSTRTTPVPVNIGQTTYPFVFYSQYDPLWSNSPYGACGTIASSGCGPSSVAMAVTFLTGKKVTPSDVASDLGKYHTCNSGSDPGLYPAAASKYGLKANDIGADMAKATEALKNGSVIIARGAGPNPFTGGGHVILLRGIDESGKILLGDPNRPENNFEAFTPEQLIGAGLFDMWVMSK